MLIALHQTLLKQQYDENSRTYFFSITKKTTNLATAVIASELCFSY